MFEFIINCLYNCCFRIKPKSKFKDVIDMIEDLTDDEVSKIINYYNRNKCC